ncbi:MAG: beta-glucosidase, partial [Pontiella sp.]|nr:beta-glucosidase [Pontiella sp.]
MLRSESTTAALLIGVAVMFCPPGQAKDDPWKEQFVDMRVEAILRQMTIPEKVGQLVLKGKSTVGIDLAVPESVLNRVRDGEIGAFLNVNDASQVRTLQEAALQSKHGIPLIFARDVIHGYKTIFPIPLGQAASWNPAIVEEGSRIAALEASSVGIRWTFAPMLDICQDSRWGRIAESPGEDPALARAMAEAYVKGFQGEDLSDPTRMAACAKHFIGYGAAIGGRDYNTTILSDELLYNLYLPPFKTALENGVATFMSSFNEVNGMPVTGSRRMLTEILRGEFGSEGFVVSDWASVVEMIDHGFARDSKHAAELAANAGLDMEMASPAYEKFLEELVREGLVPESQLDFFVRNILKTKFRLNLFDEPFVPEDHPGVFYAPSHLAKAEDAAIESAVLLKNDGILPLKPNSKILLTGPLAHQEKDQLGTW